MGLGFVCGWSPVHKLQLRSADAAEFTVDGNETDLEWARKLSEFFGPFPTSECDGSQGGSMLSHSDGKVPPSLPHRAWCFCQSDS